LNRNYLFDWANCGSYSTSPSSNVYCGPSPGSEPETQTMLAFARQMNFVKVIDVHQSGQEVLYPYACGNMATAVQSRVWEARDNLAAAANYSDRYASAGGEHFEWEFNEIGALSFLIELDTTFFPSWTQSQAEINRVIPLYLQMLREETPISGHVRDAWTGASLDADFTISGVSMYENETRKSRASNAGRWHSWIANGNYDFTFSAPGYQTATFSESLTGLSVERDVWLMPDSHPSLSVTNPTTVGSWIQFTLDNSSLHSGKSFTVIFSSSNGGPFGGSTTLPGGLELPIVWDRVSDWTVNHASLLSGSLGSQGTGLTPWLVVPPAAAGMTIWASAAIHNGTGQSFYAVSPALIFEVQ
ncbi:MAG TPA: M14 family zinc carboxypeptidase, partial [Planctomycetota bacterium]|nr:M14 family zinc carboxypeptidase [Planctomycetota bacterium]